MKKYIIFLFSIVIFLISCTTAPELPNIDFRQAMRNFVIDLSDYAKGINPDFIIIPQNGQELITDNGEGNGILNIEYIAAIDAAGRESMFYGYYNDNEITPDEDRDYLLDLCILFEVQGIEIMATDYCSDTIKMDNSYQLNFDNNFISFAADERNLNNIPGYPIQIYNENSNNVTDISLAKNFLYLINSENYSEKSDFITAVNSTNYDVVLLDLYHNEVSYTNEEIVSLKTKNNGGSRLIVAYMSIGEAEDYRYYWNTNWKTGSPVWLDKENPDWAGNYIVRYWEQNWQEIIFGNNDSYLKKILDAGFDGVYLDIIDGFENFE